MKREIEKVDFFRQTREPQTPKVPEGTVADIQELKTTPDRTRLFFWRSKPMGKDIVSFRAPVVFFS